MSNVVDLLTLFLEQVTPSKDLTSEQWSNLVSTVKNTLDNSKDYISNSADPLVEGFSTILNAIVANKYSTPGSNYYSALTLSRIGSFSSHSSLDSNTNTSSESDANQSHYPGSSRGFLDKLKDDDKNSSNSSRSSDSSRRRKGYSALVGTLKRLFLKEKLERLEAKRGLVDETDPSYKDTKEFNVDFSDYDSDFKSHGSSQEYSSTTDNKLEENKDNKENKEEKDKKKESNKTKDTDKDKKENKEQNKEKEKEEEKDKKEEDKNVFVREPYVFRSGTPKRYVDGNQTTSSKTPSPKKSTRDTNRPESMRMTFRDEMAENIPPLDLESLKQHEHLTTPGDSDNATVTFPTTARNKLDDKNKEEKDKKKESNKTKDTDKDKEKENKNKRERSGPLSDNEPETKQLKTKSGGSKTPSPKRSSSTSPLRKSKSKSKDKEKDKDKDVKQKEKDNKSKNKDNTNKEETTNENKEDKKEEKQEPVAKRHKGGHSDVMYKPLITLVDNANRIDLYVVAVEMIRASVRTIDIRRDVFNYRAIDPSVLHSNNNVDYSVQIMSSDPKMAHHINFGDVLRLKRVDANFVVDKSGRKHINIILSLKNRPSMRLWHSDHHSRELETERVNIDFNKVTDSSRLCLSYNYDSVNKNKNNNNNNNNKENKDNNNKEEDNLNGSSNGLNNNHTENVNNKNNTNRDNTNNNNKEEKENTTSNTSSDRVANPDNMVDKDKDVKQKEKDNKSKNKDNNNTDDTNKDKNKDNKNNKDSNKENKQDSNTEKDKEKQERPNSSRVRSPVLRDYQMDPDSIEKQIEILKKEAVVVFYDSKVTMTPKDVAIINFLKDWSRNLKPLDILGSSEYTKPLTESSNIPQDFIVKVIKVCPDQSMMVADKEAKAIVSNFDQILASNLFETCNPIQKGDWLKLRCFIRVFNESDRLIKLSATKFSCVTRIPPLNHRVIGEEHMNSDNNNGILVRERRVNLEELSRTSYLNDSFPRRFKRSRDFIHKLLSKQPPVQFQKASPVRMPVEKEEGEISQ